MKHTPEQKEQLDEGLNVMRDAQSQKRDIEAKDDVLAIQIIKGKGFTNIILDAYGPNETIFTLDDRSFGTFVERLGAIDSVEMGHDMFTFTRYDDRCPEMAEKDDE